MSSHQREKYAGPGSPPGQKAAAPPPKQRLQQRQLRADFLLNFQRPPAHQRPQAYAPPPRRSRPSGNRQYTPVSFTKGRFVQSSFRLYVDEITHDVVEAALNADALLQWESVRRVDLLCEQRPKCPICLEVDMIVPKITKCGHVFCAPCVMRYFLTLSEYNGKKFQRCPVCNEQASPDELTSARFEETKALRENDRASFVLAYRDAASTVVRLSPAALATGSAATAAPAALGEEGAAGVLASGDEASEADLLHLPSCRDRGWHLSRFVLLSPGEAGRLLEDELEALRSFRTVASSDGEAEILPSVDAASALVRQHRTERGALAAGTGAEAQVAPSAKEELLLPAAEVGEPDDEEHEAKEDGGDGDGWAGEPAEAAGASSPQAGSPASGPRQRRPSGSTSPAAGPSSAAPPGAAAASSSSPGLTATSPPLGAAGRGPAVSFYQVSDGRLVFLEPFFTRLLLHEHGGRWDGLPGVLEDLRLERLHETVVSEELRRRHKFLQHLPVGTQVSMAEVDLRNHLSRETKESFAEEFLKRRQQRKKDQLRSRKEERISKSRAAEEEERYYSALRQTHPSTYQTPPTAEDFAAPLPGREAEVQAPAPAAGGEEAGEAAAAGSRAEAPGRGGEGSEGSGEEGAGPTLAEKIRGRMLAQARRAQDPSAAFPELGGGVAVSEAATTAGRTAGPAPSAWGRGCGSSRVAAGKKDGGGESGGAGDAGEATEAVAAPQSGGPADEQPSFGEALEAALRSRSAAEAEQPEAAGAGGGKRKKGRAGKATTIRLFG